MTQDTIKKIEEKIYKDGSLSEERKTQLLNLLSSMKSEVTEINMQISGRMRREYEPARCRDRSKNER
jgi:hypothetical protein